jgi:hypothetical protein
MPLDETIFKKYAARIVMVSLLAAFPVPALAQNARTLLRNVAKAMGAENVRTIRYSGSAVTLSYTREIDFDAAFHDVPWTQQVDIWTTPYGFLKRALGANDATVHRQTIDGKKYNVVMFTVEDRFPLNESREIPGADFWDVTYLVVTRAKLTGYINDRNMIDKVEARIDETLIECTYAAYKDFAGLKFPTKIVEKRGNAVVLDLTVSEVHSNDK